MPGCANSSVHVVIGDDGVTGQGGYEKSADSQENIDSIREMSSKISGIDKSQNEIKRSVDKTSTTQQQMRERDYKKDTLDPDIPKEDRQKIYKRDQK